MKRMIGVGAAATLALGWKTLMDVVGPNLCDGVDPCSFYAQWILWGACGPCPLGGGGSGAS